MTRRTSSGWATASMPATASEPSSADAQRGDRAHERRLAGAVRAEHGGDRAGGGDEVEAVEGRDVAEALAQADWPRWPSGAGAVMVGGACLHGAPAEVVIDVHFWLRTVAHACRSSRGHPPRAPGQGPRHRGRAGRRAGDLDQDRPPRPRGAGDRRHPGVLAGRPRRRLVADRRCPHRSQRADRGRGQDAVHGRRPIVDGDSGGQGGAAQARPSAARDVPRRSRGGGVGDRARSRRLGRDDRPAPCAPRRATAGRRRRRPGAPRLRRPRAQRDRAHRAPARSRRQGFGVVPGRRHRRRDADVPGEPRPVRRADQRAGRATRRLRPGGDVAGRRDYDGGAPLQRPGDRARRPPGVVRTAWPVRDQRPRAGRDRRRPGRGGDRRAQRDDDRRASRRLGAAAEVVEPDEVRTELAQIGAALVSRYA